MVARPGLAGVGVVLVRAIVGRGRAGRDPRSRRPGQTPTRACIAETIVVPHLSGVLLVAQHVAEVDDVDAVAEPADGVGHVGFAEIPGRALEAFYLRAAALASLASEASSSEIRTQPSVPPTSRSRSQKCCVRSRRSSYRHGRSRRRFRAGGRRPTRRPSTGRASTARRVRGVGQVLVPFAYGGSRRRQLSSRTRWWSVRAGSAARSTAERVVL